jgi:transcriptional regulator with XRE-family HTH domain
MKMPALNLGSFIRDLRITKGYSQEYIANQLAMSQKTISRIEQDGEEMKKVARP